MGPIGCHGASRRFGALGFGAGALESMESKSPNGPCGPKGGPRGPPLAEIKLKAGDQIKKYKQLGFQ